MARASSSCSSAVLTARWRLEASLREVGKPAGLSPERKIRHSRQIVETGVRQLSDTDNEVVEQRAEQAWARPIEFRQQDALSLAAGQLLKVEGDGAVHQIGADDKVRNTLHPAALPGAASRRNP
jgi:hypothetical protein